MRENKDGRTVDSIEVINDDMLRGKIYEIRGQKVMLDFELAQIYGYSTKRFNEQVKNNIEKFDSDFMFQLSNDDVEYLRSKKSTAIISPMSRTNPYAFTEQGVYMLMTVLRGELAIRQSKALIRLFKRLKDYAFEGRELVNKAELQEVSLKVIDNTNRINSLERKANCIIRGLSNAVHNSAISGVAESFEPSGNYLIMDGEPVEGRLAYTDIYAQAKGSLLVVDNYISLGTLVLFKAVRPGVAITVASDNVGGGLHASEFAAFRTEYPSIDVSFVRTCGKVHDRYVVLDFDTSCERVFLCGTSSKDVGIRVSTILEAERTDIFHGLFSELLASPMLEFE